MSASANATESAALLRAEFKRRGIGSREISVRSEYFSLGSAVRVRIKAPVISHAEAKAIAEDEERIHYCEISGEILGGGNKYVEVSFSPECEAILARRHLDALQRALDVLGDPPTLTPVYVEGFKVLLGREHAGASWARMWIDGRPGCEISLHNEHAIQHGAFQLASALDDRRYALRIGAS